MNVHRQSSESAARRTHCAPSLETTWHVIHASVWCDGNSPGDDASDIPPLHQPVSSFSGRAGTHKFHCWSSTPLTRLLPDCVQTPSSGELIGDVTFRSIYIKCGAVCNATAPRRGVKARVVNSQVEMSKPSLDWMIHALGEQRWGHLGSLELFLESLLPIITSSSD